jgi:hypothetical protein
VLSAVVVQVVPTPAHSFCWPTFCSTLYAWLNFVTVLDVVVDCLDVGVTVLLTPSLLVMLTAGTLIVFEAVLV